MIGNCIGTLEQYTYQPTLRYKATAISHALSSDGPVVYRVRADLIVVSGNVRVFFPDIEGGGWGKVLLGCTKALLGYEALLSYKGLLWWGADSLNLYWLNFGLSEDFQVALESLIVDLGLGVQICWDVESFLEKVQDALSFDRK